MSKNPKPAAALAADPGAVVTVATATEVPFDAAGGTVTVPPGAYTVVADATGPRKDSVPVNWHPARMSVAAAEALVKSGKAVVTTAAPAPEPEAPADAPAEA